MKPSNLNGTYITLRLLELAQETFPLHGDVLQTGYSQKAIIYCLTQ